MFARLRPDNFTLAIFGAVVVASFLPVSGSAASALKVVTNLAIALLFFMHGAKISRQAALAGLTHWRLHLVILAATFVLFPLIGLVIAGSRLPVPPEMMVGILYMTVLPSTVQSSIAFTSIGKGNVAAAVCAASASNLFGIFLTPALVSLMLSGSGVSLGWDAVEGIAVQLLLPFLAGQALQPWIGGFIARHKAALTFFDRGSILLIVYLAFSEAVIGHLWQDVSVATLMLLIGLNAAVLAAVLTATTLASRWLGFSTPDEIAIVMCGSKKSLASGVPMANILFAGQNLGMIVLPIMIFHQIQLMVCAVLAQRYARRLDAEPAE
jgi:sodium/bile acid cotransporter 7